MAATSAAAQGLALPKDGTLSSTAQDAWRPTLIPGTCTRPEYPLASIRQEESGTSFISLTVDAAGSVTGTSVARSSGSSRLDQAAADSMRSCRFKPAHDSMGTPAPSTYVLRFDWRLQDAPRDPWVQLRALDGGGFAATADFSAVPFTGSSAASPEQRTKILDKMGAEARDKSRCPSIEEAAARVVPDRGLPAPQSRRSLEMWTLKQCGMAMRYAVMIVFPEDARPYFNVLPIAPSEPDPLPSGTRPW